MKHGSSPLSPVEYGLSLGLIWAVATCLMAILYSFTSIPFPLVHLAKTFYGHPIGLLQGLLAGIRAFIDAFLAGAFMALIYNKLISDNAEK